MKKYIVTMIIIFVLHSTLQFIVWSIAPGNTVFNQTNPFLSGLWPVLSFPLFYMVSQDWGNLYFWLVFCVNSIIWAMGLTGLVFLFKKS